MRHPCGIQLWRRAGQRRCVNDIERRRGNEAVPLVLVLLALRLRLGPEKRAPAHPSVAQSTGYRQNHKALQPPVPHSRLRGLLAPSDKPVVERHELQVLPLVMETSSARMSNAEKAMAERDDAGMRKPQFLVD